MPNAIMKSFAKQTKKKTKTVEKLWKKCEKIVKKEYEIDSEDERFYPLVVGCLKNLLGLNKEQSDVITTSNLGSYVFAKKMGPILTRGEPINSEPSPVKSEIKTKKKNYKKMIKEMIESSETLDLDIDDVISSNIEYFSTKFEDPEVIVESALEYSAKYLKVKPSLLDDLK